MTRLDALAIAVLLALFTVFITGVLAAALGMDPGPMPCGTEECL